MSFKNCSHFKLRILYIGTTNPLIRKISLFELQRWFWKKLQTHCNIDSTVKAFILNIIKILYQYRKIDSQLMCKTLNNC